MSSKLAHRKRFGESPPIMKSNRRLPEAGRLSIGLVEVGPQHAAYIV